MNKIVGLCGKAGAGKSSIAKYLQEHYETTVVSFADPLREMLAPVISNLKHTDFDAGTSRYFKELKEEVIEELGASPRKLLQDIGALMRGHNEDAFVNLARARIQIIEDIDSMLARITGKTKSNRTTYVIDDLRYDNEARWIKESDGFIVSIKRPKEFLHKVPKHHSENGVNPDFFDLEYNNDNNTKTIQNIANSIASELGIHKPEPKPIIDPRGSNSVH